MAYNPNELYWDETDAEAEALGSEQANLLENRLMFLGMAGVHILNYYNRNPHDIDGDKAKEVVDLCFSIHDKTREELSSFGREAEQKANAIAQIVMSHNQHLNGEWES